MSNFIRNDAGIGCRVCRRLRADFYRLRSGGRAAVEHVFARQKGPMGLFIRTIGLARATTKIGLASLVYNIKRMVWLARQPTTV